MKERSNGGTGMTGNTSRVTKPAARQQSRLAGVVPNTREGFVDRVSNVVLKGHRATVTWIDPDLLPGVDPRAVYGVAVVAFSGDDELVMVELDRGIEVPAGTVEDTDESLEHTARREAWEEACITLGELHLVQLMRVEWRDLSAPMVYVPVYAAKVETMAPFECRHETYARILVSSQEYVDVLGFGTKRDREQLIADAKTAVNRSGHARIFRR
ncbi:NUDIX domain-containing protein [Lentzea alba]|uniref:NUDIX domain-containing protein n=1 Tax=Lentzea alba TaxID=2714351 RepID=UPI0039BFEA4D